MIPQNLFLLINPIFTLMNFYLAFWAFKLGEYSYLSVFIVVFLLDKLFLAHRDQNHNLKTIIFTILIDFYLLKYLFTKRYYDEQLNTSLNAKVIVSIFPLTLLNALHNFDYDSDYAHTYLIYILFGVQIIIMITGSLLYQLSFCRNKLQLKGAVHCFLTHTSYHLSLKCMRQIQGTYGLNLDYYQIPIITLQVVIISVYMPKEKLNLILKILGVFDGILSNFQLQYNKLVKEQKDFYYYFLYNTLSYISQFLIFFLILCFVDIHQLAPNLSRESHKDIILKILVLLTIVFNSAFLLFGIKKIFKDLFRNKYFILYYPNDIIHASKFIEESKQKINKYYIYSALRFSINCNSQSISIDFKLQKKSYDQINDLNEVKCPYYTLQKSISQQLKQVKNIKYDIIQTSNLSRQCCLCSIQKLFSEEEHVHSINNQHLSTIGNYQLNQVLLNRFENGLFFTEFTEEVVNKMNQDQQIQFLKMKAQVIQIESFNKHVKSYMTMMPQFVIYDLFASD